MFDVLKAMHALSLIHTTRIDEFILFSHVYILFTIIVDEKSTNHINEPIAVAANYERMNEQNEKKNNNVICVAERQFLSI